MEVVENSCFPETVSLLSLPSSNFLESTCDDEICVVHGDKISRELAREVVLVVELLPVDIRIRVLGLLQSMSNGALYNNKPKNI